MTARTYWIVLQGAAVVAGVLAGVLIFRAVAG
jgi:hypothetical protein